MVVWLLTIPFVSAQNNDERTKESLLSWSSEWWYIDYDGNDVDVVDIEDDAITFEIPLIDTIDGYVVEDYYIVRWPDDYQNVIIDDDLDVFRDSIDYETDNDETMYTLDVDARTLTLRVDELFDSNEEYYVYVFPEDHDNIDDFRGSPLIFDVFTLADAEISSDASSSTTSNNDDEEDTWSDLYDASSDKRVDNISCMRDDTKDRVTLFWEVNQAYSDAQRVEVSYRPNEEQWSMTVVGTPLIDNERIIIDTAHREIQLFRLKPVDQDRAMVGKEVQYICKPDNDPDNPIPVVPDTGPKETTAIVIILAILWYAIYRKTKKAH